METETSVPEATGTINTNEECPQTLLNNDSDESKLLISPWATGEVDISTLEEQPSEGGFSDASSYSGKKGEPTTEYGESEVTAVSIGAVSAIKSSRAKQPHSRTKSIKRRTSCDDGGGNKRSRPVQTNESTLSPRNRCLTSKNSEPATRDVSIILESCTLPGDAACTQPALSLLDESTQDGISSKLDLALRASLESTRHGGIRISGRKLKLPLNRRLNVFAQSPSQSLVGSTRKATCMAGSSSTLTERDSRAKQLVKAVERMNTPVTNAKRIPVLSTRTSLPPSQMNYKDASIRRKLHSKLSSMSLFRRFRSVNNDRVAILSGTGGSAVLCKHASNLVHHEDDEITQCSKPARPDFCLSNSASAVPAGSAPDLSTTLREEKSGGKLKLFKATSLHGRRVQTVEGEKPLSFDVILPAQPLAITNLPSSKRNVTSSIPLATSVGSACCESHILVPKNTASAADAPFCDSLVETCRNVSSVGSTMSPLGNVSNMPFDIKCVRQTFTGHTGSDLRLPTVMDTEDVVESSKSPEVPVEFEFRLPEVIHIESRRINTLDPSNASNSTSIATTTECPPNKAFAFGMASCIDNLPLEVECKEPDVSDLEKNFKECDYGTFPVAGRGIVNQSVERATIACRRRISSFSAPIDTLESTSEERDTCWSAAVQPIASQSEKPVEIPPSPFSYTQPMKLVLPAKPGASGFTSLFKMKPGWDCGMCLSRNQEKEGKCLVCKTPQSGITPEEAEVIASTYTSVVPDASSVPDTFGQSTDSRLGSGLFDVGNLEGFGKKDGLADGTTQVAQVGGTVFDAPSPASGVLVARCGASEAQKTSGPSNLIFGDTTGAREVADEGTTVITSEVSPCVFGRFTFGADGGIRSAASSAVANTLPPTMTGSAPGSYGGAVAGSAFVCNDPRSSTTPTAGSTRMSPGFNIGQVASAVSSELGFATTAVASTSTPQGGQWMFQFKASQVNPFSTPGLSPGRNSVNAALAGRKIKRAVRRRKTARRQ